jgi:uncharacterized Zn-binding protein involved in type VI secretion
MPNISLLDDPSSHGGTIISANQASVTVGGKPVAVAGAMHLCPIPFHGITPITPITKVSTIEGKLIITTGATAGCGAQIQSPENGCCVE